MTTLHDLFCLALRAEGATEDRTARTSKYTVFTGGRAKDGLRYYVGPSGAIRIGRTIATSTPLRDARKAVLLALGKHAIAEQLGL